MTVQSALKATAPTGLKLPKIGGGGGGTNPSSSTSVKTPKTPQDEAMAFFASKDAHTGEAVQVWELWLEDDGGPGESKSVSWSSVRDQRKGMVDVRIKCEDKTKRRCGGRPREHQWKSY